MNRWCRRGRRALQGLLVLQALLPREPGPALGHAKWTTPRPRDEEPGYKPTRSGGFVLPCGVARAASQPVTTLQAGATVTVGWVETIYHPGCFLLEFARSDSDTFERLKVVPHPASTASGQVYTEAVTLPDVLCTGCVLRVRQYMRAASPCPPANLSDSDANLYYSCANIQLTSDGVAPAPPQPQPQPPADDGGACSVGGGTPGAVPGAASATLLLLLLRRARRRRRS